jgi:hypothetical protein
MKGERDSRTTEPRLGDLLAAHGGRLRFPGVGESWPVPVDGEDGGDVPRLHGEYGRIRMLQDRLDEAERLRSAIDRAKKLRSPGYAKLAVKYADVLHRLHRNDEAIAFLDRIEPVLQKYPDTLDDQAAAATKLRKAIVAGH